MQEKLRILNLEDNPNDSELVQARLEEEGIACDITRVETEPEFVAALARKDGFDLILADYKLPSFGGLQALALAQEKRPEIPFILISGTIGEEHAVECLKGGAADYILKDKLFRLGASVRRALGEAEEKAERKRAEEALRESSQFNRQIIDSAQEGIIVYGPDLRYLVWNPFMEQLTGIPASDVIGRHPLEVFPFLKEVGMLASVEKALRGEVAEAKRFPFTVPKTGRSGWTSDKSAPLRNSRGEIVGVIATVRDITEHVHAEEAQRLSEVKYLLLNEGIMDGFVSVDMKGNILEFNRAYRDMLGYSDEELRKRTYVELTPARWHEVERKIIEDQIMKRGFSDIYEKEYIRKDGTVIPVEFRTYLIRDADSKPVGMWGIARDITGRKRSEAALRSLNDTLMAAQSMSKVGYWSYDVKTGIPIWSEQMFLIFGVDPEKGVPHYDEHRKFWHPDDWDLFNSSVQECIEKGKPYNIVVRVIFPDGSVHFVNTQGFPRYDEKGEVYELFGTSQDITEHKRTEERLILSYKKIEEEAEVSDSLLQIVEALNATLDEKALVQTLTQITPRYLKFDRVSVFLGDEDLDTFTFSGGYGFAPLQEGYLLSKVFRKGDFPAVDKLLNGETVCIENARETDLLPKDLVNTLELGSTIMVPISYRGTIIGAIVGTYKTPNALKLKDLTLLKGLADGIGVALQNSRLYRESTHRLMQLSGKMETIKAMAQLDREILASTDRKTILQTAAALVNRIIPCERVAVVLMEGDYYSVATEWGLGQFAGKKYPVRGSHCEAFRQNQMSIYSPDISAEKCAYHSEQSLLGIRSVLLVPLVTRDGVAGFLDLGTSQHGKLTPVDLSTAESIASQIAVALENARLFEDLEQLLVSTITSLASAIDAKSPWTKGHSERVTKYAVEIGEEMGLSEHERERLKLSGLLHDVGKIGTYDILLDKPSKLTDEEFELVKKHPRKGAEILSPIKQLTDIIPGVRHHHERYDGRGYPDGLTGEEIPLQARILCVADSFDSMTADRPYRPAPGTAYAISEFERCRGTQFDPVVVEAFLRVLSRRDSNGAGKAHE